MTRPRAHLTETFSLLMTRAMRDELAALARQNERSDGAELRHLLAAGLRRARRRPRSGEG